jgi:hypothetical protein
MSSWIQEEFACLELGDERLNRRLRQVVEKIWQSPQRSTAGACGSWKETMAAYRLFDNEKVTPEQILLSHREQVVVRCRLAKVVLHIQDTTELDYSRKKSLAGTGPLSEESRQGFFAHNEYVVQAEGGLPLGLWHTDIHARDPEEHGESEQRKQLPIEQKESFRWLEGYRRACTLQELCPEVQVISTSDRESDIYEIFVEHQQRRALNQVAADWIIRSNQDRALLSSGSTAETDPELLKLRCCIAQAPVLGQTTVTIRSKQQLKKKKGVRQLTHRTGREAVLEVRACQVQLRPPFRKGSKLGPITLQVVMAKEIDPPAGEDPIEWILLTNLAVQNLDDALRVIALYCLRWQIEVFHKILKSGCRVEQAQLKTAERLRPRITLQMVVAWRIHHVTLVGRACPDLPCGMLFDRCEWEPVVVVVRGKGAHTTEPTLAEMINYIGQLGGHLNRKSDGHPGPQTIWRGMDRMHDFAILWQAWQQTT